MRLVQTLPADDKSSVNQHQLSLQLHAQGQLIYNLIVKPGHFFKRVIALPQDHGSWVFLFSPLLIGLFAGQNFSTGSLALIIAVVSAFLIRQPVTIATKIYSDRRPRSDLPAALFWIVIYSLILAIAFAILLAFGYFFILFLAIPGVCYARFIYMMTRIIDRLPYRVREKFLSRGPLVLAKLFGGMFRKHR